MVALLIVSENFHYLEEIGSKVVDKNEKRE